MNTINEELWAFSQGSNEYLKSDIVYDKIVSYILDGILRPGEKIPSIKKVADLNNIPQKRMERIYKWLVNDGWVDASERLGTFVAEHFPGYERLYPKDLTVDRLPRKLSRTIADENQLLSDFTTIGLDTPSPHYLPRRSDLANISRNAMAYENRNQEERMEIMEGFDLNAAVMKYLNSRRGFAINAKCLEVIGGRRESLEQIFKVLLDPGDVIINTSGRDDKIGELFINCQVGIHHICPAETDFITELKQLLEYTSIKALYLRPQCSYPEGYTMSVADCDALLELAKLHDFYIVEEDDYHELWYDNKPFVPLICREHDGHVIYCGALSILSAYLQDTRTIVAAADFITLMRGNDITHNTSRCVLYDHSIVDLLKNDKICEYILKMRQEKKRHKFEAWMHLTNYLGHFVKCERPLAGLSLWVVFADAEILEESLSFLGKSGFKVLYFPGSRRPGPGLKHVRFGFGTWDVDEPSEPLKLLCEKFSADRKGHL